MKYSASKTKQGVPCVTNEMGHILCTIDHEFTPNEFRSVFEWKSQAERLAELLAKLLNEHQERGGKIPHINGDPTRVL